MDTAKAEVLAFAAFPRAHWRKTWSTNPIGRIDKEIKRRSRVVGIFPNKTPPSSASSERSCSTCTTNGTQPNAATYPRDPWPSPYTTGDNELVAALDSGA